MKPANWLNRGLVVLNLAMAAAMMGEIDQACAHAADAHRIFVKAGSKRQLARLDELRAGALDADHQAVRDLDEEMRANLAGTRYMLGRTARETVKVHLATCRYVGRGAARAWPAAEFLAPDVLAASPLLGDPKPWRHRSRRGTTRNACGPGVAQRCRR